ncbi:hypothetical protein [Burkholderia sp. AU31624]|nr:hypothetical protein [Burkholderia sp. AU31624]
MQDKHPEENTNATENDVILVDATEATQGYEFDYVLEYRTSDKRY